MITCFFGLPGAGKSSMLAKIARKEIKRIEKGKSHYRMVLSNYYIEGCYEFRFEDLGVYDMDNCLVLLDELTLDADSRDFKNFNRNLKEFFIMHRHYGVDIVYATQQYDGVDKKIRDLTHDLYYLKKAGLFSYATAIFRTIAFTEESDIKYGYRPPSIFAILFDAKHNIKLCFRPLYYKYFDSFEHKRLPHKRFVKFENKLPF